MGAELISQVMRALWRFLHDTGHPQVRAANTDEVAFELMDRSTIRKMESALMKMHLMSEDADGGNAHEGVRPVTADLVFITMVDVTQDSPPAHADSAAKSSGVNLPPIDKQPVVAQSSPDMDKRSLA